jgi:hypothetical protein
MQRTITHVFVISPDRNWSTNFVLGAGAVIEDPPFARERPESGAFVKELTI